MGSLGAIAGSSLAVEVTGIITDGIDGQMVGEESST